MRGYELHRRFLSGAGLRHSKRRWEKRIVRDGGCIGAGWTSGAQDGAGVSSCVGIGVGSIVGVMPSPNNIEVAISMEVPIGVTIMVGDAFDGRYSVSGERKEDEGGQDAQVEYIVRCKGGRGRVSSD